MDIDNLKKSLELAWSTYRYTSKTLDGTQGEVEKKITSNEWNLYLDAVQVYYKKRQT
jgi:hypothetical protein